MTILLLNYRNSGHQVFNGDCCDNLNFCSWNDCDNLFKFCATALGSTVSCSLSGGQLTTGILGDDDFSFPGQGGYLGGGLNNPITFSFQEWKVRTCFVTSFHLSFFSLALIRFLLHHRVLILFFNISSIALLFILFGPFLSSFCCFSCILFPF